MRTFFILIASFAATGTFAQEIKSLAEEDTVNLRIDMLQQPLEHAKDTVSQLPVHHADLNKDALHPSANSVLPQMTPPALPDFPMGATMPASPRFILGAGRTELMGLGDIDRAVFGAGYDYDRLRFDASMGAEKYHFLHTTRNNAFISGALTYRIDGHWSVTAFGTYSLNPFYHSMAAFPYVTTSRYGGTVNWQPDGSFGLRLGVQREYDPFARRWMTRPVVAPSFKIDNFKVEMDVGSLLLDGLRHFVEKSRSRESPNIMPHR